MELDELVEQIMTRVKEKISQMEESSGCRTLDGEKKPKVLILSEEHGTACHAFLESEVLRPHVEIVCALNKGTQCELEQFDIIVLRNVSNTALGKITEGIGDTTFTEAVIKAILLGKQIWIPNEELELFQYRETAPKLYYGMMMQKIELLKNVGIQFCNGNELENILLKKESFSDKKCVISQQCEAEVSCNHVSENTVNLTKRVITEQDIRSAFEQHATKICITEKAIITALAREYAEQKRISFIIG